MDCKRTANLMMKYFDHTIGDLEEKEMTLHMKGCNCCRLEFQWMKEAICSVETMEEIEAPEEFEGAVMGKISINYYNPSQIKSNFSNYMAFIIAIAAVFFCGALYLYYGTVDFKEAHDLIRFVFTLMDFQNIFQNLVALISKNTIKMLILGIRWLNDIAAVLMNMRINIYLLIVGSLCGIFAGIQHWLVSLTYGTGYGGGKIYEK
ncbi:hypothetical protein [Geosporobacter ferrireducens]|uniref:Zinc-finger domain-containing protein n=1 Tax=Geosporobacter ferrireducens TaxID=1424294 RepID=A0A1D8GGH4_9FIRM|nr:hypothetical protein [Geosporobacter ferrireducens]AOT69993.1 hypothetical protein Gferi_10585 [Geosporobacter ferrireducens]MTI53464.1 hypothetical protein [Geosporobacter ferrireducens]